MSKKTAVLLIGFGGPSSPQEVEPFLQTIAEGTQIPRERLQKVAQHYEAIGGTSPFNAITYKQKEALENYLKAHQKPLPVGVAFRHSTPTFQDAFESFKKHGVERTVGFVLASFRSWVSLQWYKDKAAQGRQMAGADSIEIVYTDPFEYDPLYLEAQAERVEEVWSSWSVEKKAATFVIYTAHSIPASMCEQSSRENGGPCYGFQFHEASRRLSERLRISHWNFAYQSRSGNPRDLWMEPDVKEVIKTLDRKKFHNVLLVPVGFLCDNVEVIYDLDVEAKQTCLSLGLGYFRASTVMDHPKFIAMVARQVLEKV